MFAQLTRPQVRFERTEAYLGGLGGRFHAAGAQSITNYRESKNLGRLGLSCPTRLNSTTWTIRNKTEAGHRLAIAHQSQPGSLLPALRQVFEKVAEVDGTASPRRLT